VAAASGRRHQHITTGQTDKPGAASKEQMPV
jgi:hypothetical protein